MRCRHRFQPRREAVGSQTPADICFPVLVCIQHDLHLSELLTQTLLTERRGWEALQLWLEEHQTGMTERPSWQRPNGRKSHSRQGHVTPRVSVSAFAFHIPHGLRNPSEHGGASLQLLKHLTSEDAVITPSSTSLSSRTTQVPRELGGMVDTRPDSGRCPSRDRMAQGQRQIFRDG